MHGVYRTGQHRLDNDVNFLLVLSSDPPIINASSIRLKLRLRTGSEIQNASVSVLSFRPQDRDASVGTPQLVQARGRKDRRLRHGAGT